MTNPKPTEHTEPTRTGADRQLRSISLTVSWGAFLAALVLVAGVITHRGGVVVAGIALFVVIGVLIFLRTFLAVRRGSHR